MEFIWSVGAIIFADIILSGDNALVIGMAASTLPAEMRRRAIFFGMALAAGLRIVFALMASVLVQYPIFIFIGGLLLAWVCWRFFCDLRAGMGAHDDVSIEYDDGMSDRRKMIKALFTITIADVSMSIDNVFAVVAIARDNVWLLFSGLALAILMMAFFATIIMRVMTRYSWIGWIGLVFLIYLTYELLHDGWHAFASLIGL